MSVHEDFTPRGVNPPLQPLLQVRLKKCTILVFAELAQVLAKESPKQNVRNERVTYHTVPAICRQQIRIILCKTTNS
jgi:hypothetical protein